MKVAIGGVRGIPARYGGFETSAEETARRLDQLGHEVTVYCRSRQGHVGESACGGVKLVYLRGSSISYLETITHSIAVGLHLAFRERNVEVVHMYNAASAVGGMIVRLAGHPLIMTLDGVEWQREKWNGIARTIWKMSTWLAMRVANVVVCDSQTVQAVFEKRYKVGIRHIPYGAKRLEKVSEVYRVFGLEDRRYFIFVGRLVPEKGVDVLLDAYNLVGSEIPLVIIGNNENDPDYVAMLRNRAGVNVRFLGYRYGEEYESLLSHALAYVTASRLEGTSPSLLAAMGAQVCCIVNAIPENQETGGDSVIYFDGSTQDLAAKWRSLSKHPEVIDQYALKGFDRVRSYYDWDVVTRQYIAAYAEASAQERGTRMPACSSTPVDRD